MKFHHALLGDMGRSILVDIPLYDLFHHGKIVANISTTKLMYDAFNPMISRRIDSDQEQYEALLVRYLEHQFRLKVYWAISDMMVILGLLNFPSTLGGSAPQLSPAWSTGGSTIPKSWNEPDGLRNWLEMGGWSTMSDSDRVLATLNDQSIQKTVKSLEGITPETTSYV